MAALIAKDGSVVRSVWHQVIATSIGYPFLMFMVTYALIQVIVGYDLAAQAEFPGINDLIYRSFWGIGFIALSVMLWRNHRSNGMRSMMVVMFGRLFVARLIPYPRIDIIHGVSVQSVSFEEFTVLFEISGMPVLRGNPVLFDVQRQGDGA